MSVAALELVAPAHLWLPDDVSSPAARDAAELAEQAGLLLDPEQRLMLDVFLAEQSDGRPVFETCVVEPRQNGKTVAAMAAVLYDLFVAGDRMVVWTAHEFATAMTTFREFKGLLAGAPFLSSRVARENNANGEEGFVFSSGAELRFRARTKAAGRGLAGDKVILDEAFALEASHLGALLPILSTRQSAQVRYASSAGLERSEALRGIRDRAYGRSSRSLAYVEWRAPMGCADGCTHDLGVAGCCCDDPAAWQQANPGLPRRRSDWKDHIRAERESLKSAPGEFVRERMGWWDEPVDVADLPYPVQAWQQLAVSVDEARSMRDESSVPTFGIDTNPVRTWSAVAWCRDRVDGLRHVEVADYRPGTDWVVGRALALCDRFPGARFGIAGDSQAVTFVPELERAGVDVETVKSRDLALACGLLADGIREQTCRHLDQDALNDAVRMARRRELEGAWALARKGGDIAPLVAVVLAHGLNRRLDDEPFNIW